MIKDGNTNILFKSVMKISWPSKDLITTKTKKLEKKDRTTNGSVALEKMGLRSKAKSENRNNSFSFGKYRPERRHMSEKD